MFGRELCPTTTFTLDLRRVTKCGVRSSSNLGCISLIILFKSVNVLFFSVILDISLLFHSSIHEVRTYLTQLQLGMLELHQQSWSRAVLALFGMLFTYEEMADSIVSAFRLKEENKGSRCLTKTRWMPSLVWHFTIKYTDSAPWLIILTMLMGNCFWLEKA